MSRRILIGLAGCFLVTAASAADMPVRRIEAPQVAFPTYDWSGPYIGGHVGYGFDAQRGANTSITTPQELSLIDPTQGTAVETTSLSRSQFKSVLGGPQIGYNVQSGFLVAGIEGDISFGDMRKDSIASDTIAVNGPLNPFGSLIAQLPPGELISIDQATALSVRHKLGTFGTIRGRLGVAYDRFFFYATGGAVFAELKTAASWTSTAVFSDNLLTNLTFAATQELNNNTASARVSKFSVGGSVGGGVEAYVAPNWSVKAEYLYVALPKQTVSVTTVSAGTQSATFENKFHIVRAGINYHF
jgi:outer membrane immunogenic protein